MLIHKLRLTAMALLLLAAVATGAGWLARSLAMKDGPVNRPTAQAAPRRRSARAGTATRSRRPGPDDRRRPRPRPRRQAGPERGRRRGLAAARSP